MPGARTLILRTASRLGPEPADARAELLALDRRWGESSVWSVLKRESGRLTPFYYLTAAGLRRDAKGRVERVPEDRRIFLDVLGRTFMISATTTLLCLVLGYPAAHLLAGASSRWAPVLMVMVLLPFWTSTLVRTTAWIVLLQNEGLVNRTLRMLGLISGSLPLFANRFAVLVAMTHVLLPYMVLPLYGVMKSVPPDLLRAASGLGANPIRAFVRVYVPQTLPGIYAGSILVFVLALGFYVTPALVGGPSDQMMSYFVALYTNESLNWGLASALGTTLLISAALIYLLALKFGVRIKST
jgi:putative spermidine/putrescine transport system permease protein